MITLRLPADIEQRLDSLARTTGRTKSLCAREAILEYLEDHEDTSLAEDALHEHFRSGGHALSTTELLERYG